MSGAERVSRDVAVEPVTPASRHDDSTRIAARRSATVRSTATAARGTITPTPLDVSGMIVQAKLTVGPAGDAYEREADAIADDVVDALHSTPTATASATGPRAQRSARPVSPVAPASAGSASVRVQRSGLGDWVKGRLGWGATAEATPPKDPMQKVHDEFMQRITSLQSEIPQLKGQSVAATGEALWAAYSGTISGAKGMSGASGEIDLASKSKNNKVPESAPGRRDNSATNPMYYNEGPAPAAAPGHPLQRDSYKTNMSESFNLLTNALKGLSQLQFDKYQTFAFWNSPGAKDVAVAAKGGGVLALESSAIGGLFDGFGSYEEFSKGIESTSWDPQLWAELSRAYASMVMDAIVKDRSKRIVVICGLGFDNPGYNIWNSIESLTLKLGAARAKLVEQDLINATTYLGVAGHMDGNRPVVDMTSTCEGIAGTWVSTKTAADMTAEQKEQATRRVAAPAASPAVAPA